MIRVWDPATGAAVGEPLTTGYDGHDGTVLALAVGRGSSGATVLASGSEDRMVRVWDPDAGRVIGGPLRGHVGWVNALTMWNTADGSLCLASAAGDGTVVVWDPETGATVGPPLDGTGAPLWAVASWVGSDGPRLASAGEDEAVHIWDPETGARIGEPLTGHRAALWALAAWTGPAGVRLASASNDGTIIVWDPENGVKVSGPLAGYTGWAPTLAVWRTGDGSMRLASPNDDGAIHLWDPDTGADVGPALIGKASWAPAVVAGTDRDGAPRLASTYDDGTIRIWDPETGAVVAESHTGHTAGVWALTTWLGPDGARRLASAGDDGTIRVWDPDTGAAVGGPLGGHTAGVWALATWSRPAGGRRLASTGDDGTVRIWDLDSGAAVGPPLVGHHGWVPALTVMAGADGDLRLASAGIDGTIRVWDPDAETAVGAALTGHTGWVMALTSWTTPSGATRLASGGNDATIRIWDPDTGTAIGDPLTGHTGWIRALTAWTCRDGAARMASASYDGTVRVWDPDAGTAVGDPLTGHVTSVAALTIWTGQDGAARLASSDGGGTIRIWDPDTGAAIGQPLTGHTHMVLALTSWAGPDGTVRLASAGYDGTVRLWDPNRGRAIRTIEVGPVVMWGLSDTPARRDILGRQRLAAAVAEQLTRRGLSDAELGGPTVVSIEGPWGCGKSTLMELIRQHLPEDRTPPARPAATRLSVRDALQLIRRHAETTSPAIAPTKASDCATVTAWFNPWAHQSGEQVWAGFAGEIIEAVSPVLYPTRADRERYWFTRNLRRIDRYALRRVLHRRIVSPLLAVALATVAAPLAVLLTQLHRPLDLLGHTLTSATLALGVPAAFLIAGLVHTAIRHRYGHAAHYLPAELLHGPVTTPAAADRGQGADTLADPLNRARAGSLYLYQHDIGDLLADLGKTGHSLVVFIDDIDRCRAGTIAEVFEAVNLFLSGVTARTPLQAQFVIGLDPAVVAAHLDGTHTNPHQPKAALYGEDPTPGWAYLRKLVQLPVTMPQISREGISRFVETATATGNTPGPAPPTPRPTSTSPQPQPLASTGRSEPASADATPPTPEPALVETLAWRNIEQHPRVQQMIVQRLSAHPDSSIREGKRLLNVWQLYQRILTTTHPFDEPADAITRACNLVLLAEIVTRWPALQRHIHRHVDNQRGLQLLATAAADDNNWQRAVALLQIDLAEHGPAVTSLRHLLRNHDGHAVADLAAQLL